MMKKEMLDRKENIIHRDYKPVQKLKGSVALITGGDSGIGRSVAVLFAKEGADIAIVYHESDNDAGYTRKLVEEEGLAHEALTVMDKGSTIINTASVVAFRGNEQLVDYSATKGALVSFTRALSKHMATKGIRVNAVAPGPIWTPLIFETFDAAHIKQFGKKTPMKRAGLPSEVAPAFLFLASPEASYITGQVIHVNGGEAVGG